MQFRCELFNAINHPNLYVNTGLADFAFLDFVSAIKLDSRNIQFAILLTF